MTHPADTGPPDTTRPGARAPQPGARAPQPGARAPQPGARAAPPRLRRSVLRTAACNALATAAGAVTGIIVARELGPTVRGEYAAIMVWFAVVTQLGQLGQTTATTYHVARDPDHGRDYVATSRTLMLAVGSLTAAAGVLAAPLLADRDAAVLGHRLMFATCLAAHLGAAYTFSLLARDSARWNLVRLSQPAAFLVLVLGGYAAGMLSLTLVLAAFALTTVGQTMLAYLYCRRVDLHRGRAGPRHARPLLRYGLGHLAGAVPRVIAGRLDQLVLSMAVVPAALGNYAVAMSLVTLAAPVTSALSSIVFPRLASATLTRPATARLQCRALLAGAAVSVGVIAPLALTAGWLVPLVFGASFADAPTLVYLLAPAGVLLSVGKVCEGLLRGHGRPYAVARAQWAAAVVMVALLITLVPAYGAAGAALAASVTAAVALAAMLLTLHRLGKYDFSV